MHDAEREAGIIPIPPKLLTRLHTLELENSVYQTKFNANQVTVKMLIEGYLEDACGVDLDAEKWVVEITQRRFRKADVRPPELQPEMEVKPQNGKPTSATDYLPVEEKGPVR